MHTYESQNVVNNKTKHAKFSGKMNIYYPLIKNVQCSENLGCFVFLLPLSWDVPFYLITDDLLI